MLLVVFLTSSNGAVFDCDFIYISIMNIDGIYKCKAQNLDIQSDNERITGVSGEHKAQKANEDVQIFIIENQVCHYLPTDINRHFPKVYHLDIRNTGLKAVTGENMKMFPKLKHLYIRNNPIEALPANLFEHNPLVEFINLNDNRIKKVGTNVFEPLKKLISLDIERNDCIDDFAIQPEEMRKLIRRIARKCV